MDTAHSYERLPQIRAFFQVGRFTQIHKVFNVNRAVKDASFFRPADKNVFSVTFKEIRAAFFRNRRKHTVEIVFRHEQNLFRLLFRRDSFFNPYGDIHAGEQVVLQIRRRFPYHL